jgi:hypothetical protein
MEISLEGGKQRWVPSVHVIMNILAKGKHAPEVWAWSLPATVTQLTSYSQISEVNNSPVVSKKNSTV